MSDAKPARQTANDGADAGPHLNIVDNRKMATNYALMCFFRQIGHSLHVGRTPGGACALGIPEFPARGKKFPAPPRRESSSNPVELLVFSARIWPKNEEFSQIPCARRELFRLAAARMRATAP
jgi:hypothetical protein